MSECIECGDKDGPWANVCEACSVRIDNATMKLDAQVSALTEQRDAAVAACKAADKWLDGEQRFHPDVDGIASLRAQLAAVIAMTEGTKG